MQLTFLKNMKIRNKIILVPVLAGIAFALILVVNTYLGSRNNELISSIDQQYFPALQISRELEELLSDIQSNMQYAASAMDEDVLLESDAMRDRFLVLTDSSIKNNILSEGEAGFLETEFKSYYPLARSTTMQMITDGLNENVIANLDDMQSRYKNIKSELAGMTSEKKEAMTLSVSEAKDNQQTVVVAILIITLLSIVLQLLATLFSTRSVTVPLQNIVKAANEMAMGKVDVELNINSTDEIGELAQSTTRLLETTKSLAKTAEAIGQGNYSATIELRSEEDILGSAIAEMQNNLLNMTKENERQDWLKTGLADLANNLRGDQDVVELAQNVIHFTAKYTEAKIGAIYLLENENLHLTGSYAYKKRKNLSSDFKVGEGLVGQCALEKKTILISEVPEDYIKINSGLGEATPLNIIVIPLVYDDEINGVIELGSFREFDDLQISFFEQASENITIAFQSAIARKRVNELLEETQSQTAELQAQQEELRVTNEELEEQTQNLQQSELRLKKQQEELKKSNLDLEKHTNELKEKQVALEAARSDIEQKAMQLEESSKYKSEFLANMSHELRTPLNSIQILSRLLIENKSGNLTEKQVNYASTINSSGSDLLNLINEILDLSKIEAGKMSLNLENMEIDSFASYLKNNFEHQTDQKGLTFKVNINESLPGHIITDRQRVEQIIKNMISNALKFTESGSITVDITPPDSTYNLQRSGLKHTSAVAISVRDTGIGIDEKNLNKIFEAFQQEDGTTSRKYGGTGLGLSISVQLAKLLGGEVQVESTLGKGSTFHLFLPVKHPQAGKLDNIKDTLEDVSELSPKEVKTITVKAKKDDYVLSNEIRDDRNDLSNTTKTILIIEDDNNFSKVLFDFTREKGYKGLIASDGEAGLQLAYQYKPDAIILDIGLPRMDGWMVMEKLKQNSETRHIPVYFMSGHDKRMDAMQKGAIGYLTKPVSKEELDLAFSKIDMTISKDIKKLLVIEDDDVMRHSMVELIGNGDITISEAVKGKEALKMLKSNEFDCIVLDLGLSDISGFDLVEKIKNDKKIQEIPIIIYTGKDLTKKEQSQLNRYAESIIIKGVKSTDRLLDELSLFLHRMEKDNDMFGEDIEYNISNGEDIFKGKKILIADDDPRNIFSLTSILEDKEMEVIIAEDGVEALDMLQKNKNTVDLVLMDIMMPEMDGYQAMQEIRKQKQYKDLPIIALTAKAMKGDRQKCIDAGANDYLSKPLDVEKLLSLLQIWLYKKVG